MTIQDLVDLYILQKNFHASKSEEDELAFNKRYDELLEHFKFSAQDVIAPNCFEGQPDIPFVLFRPHCSYVTPRPLIIHTHGGPHTYFDKNTRHAEILYYLSQGYVVACPNYRGSTGYPYIDKDDDQHWSSWMKMSYGYYHYGPEDIYAVTLCMQKESFVISGKTVLCGRSFGSYINSHFTSRFNNNIIASMFSGMHLSGGNNYPEPTALPRDIPILISHGNKDTIAPAAYARQFMGKMLLRQLSDEMKGKLDGRVQTFIAEHGNHHIIAPELQMTDTEDPAYKELTNYFMMQSGFLRAVLDGDQKFTPENSREQYKRVISESISDFTDVEAEINRRIRAYDYVQALTYKKPKSLLRKNPDQYTQRLCPTMAHLKLQLGERYTSHIELDLRMFLREHYKPAVWTNKKKRDTHVGADIAADEGALRQLAGMIRREQGFLQEHPDYMVMYHGGEHNVLLMYAFINMWKKTLTDRSPESLRSLKEMRLFDYTKKSLSNIDVFLQVMRANKDLEKYFNYLPGFNERAAAFTPGLTFNPHNTASSPIWYYEKSEWNKNLEITSIMTIFFKLLGIYSKERVERYQQLFKKEWERSVILGFSQGVMQQFFVPYKIADDKGYGCQIWGEEFNANTLDLHKPSSIRAFCEEPARFEMQLRGQSYAFTNHGDCPVFGKTEEGFNYSAALQIRFLIHDDPSIYVNTYIKDVDDHEVFCAEMANLIKADYTDFLTSTSHLSGALASGLGRHRALHQQTAGIFKPARTTMSLDELEIHQLQLRRGLSENSSQPWHWDILQIDTATRIAAQIKISNEACLQVFPLSLCIHLQEYTYYELLMEALNLNLPNKNEFIFIDDDSLVNACEYPYDKSKYSFMTVVDHHNGSAERLFREELVRAVECYRKYCKATPAIRGQAPSFGL